jgi:hypothetical protein
VASRSLKTVGDAREGGLERQTAVLTALAAAAAA